MHLGFEVNGFRLNKGTQFCVMNNSGIWLCNIKQEPYLIVSEIDGKKCRMNDCTATADPQGRLLAGSWFYNADRDYPRGQLIVVNKDLTATILDEGFDLANGIALSPDYSTLLLPTQSRELFMLMITMSKQLLQNGREYWSGFPQRRACQTTLQLTKKVTYRPLSGMEVAL